MCHVPFEAFFPFGRKSPGLLNSSYGSTQKADQKFREKMLIFYGVVDNRAGNKKDRNPTLDAVFL
jgi:hypothetical protein